VRDRWFALLTGMLAVLFWVALGILVNTRPPTIGYQVVFVIGVGMAMAATVMLVSYLLQTREHKFFYATPPWRNALRQGGLVGFWGATLVALRLVGALTLASGVLLGLLVASCELLSWLRRRS